MSENPSDEPAAEAVPLALKGAAEILRAFENAEVVAYPRAQTDVGNAPPIRTIEVGATRFDRQVGLGEKALAADPPLLFKRAGRVVVPVLGAFPTGCGKTIVSHGFEEVGEARLAAIAATRIVWTKFDARKKRQVEISAPSRHLRAIADGALSPYLPPVSGIIAAPCLRGDGTIIRAPGYDRESGLFYFCKEPLDIGDLTECPSRKLANEALEELAFLFSGFPFVDAKDRAVAFAFAITAICRPAFESVPLFAMTAPAPGSGKTHLIDVVTALATGLTNPVVSAAGDPEELEKRVVAAILAGFPVVALDNLSGPLKSDLLCQATTQQLMRIRPLGTSSDKIVLNCQTFCATGNALVIAGDLARRTLVCKLDARVERPELRAFDFDPVETALRDRARYVRAALILGLFGMRGAEVLPPFAGFEAWSRGVRRGLVRLGVADPVESIVESRDLAPDLMSLRTLLGMLTRKFEGRPFTTRAAIEAAAAGTDEMWGEAANDKTARAEFRDALLMVAADAGGRISSKRLGRWFSKNVDRICGGRVLRQAPTDLHEEISRWAIETLDEAKT
jgi:putative DNA primase/helicase